MREMTSGLRFPEGPVWLRDGSVLLVEIARGTLTRVAPDGSKSVIATIPGGPNGAAIGKDGACYICNNGGFRWHEDKLGLRPTGEAEDYIGGSLQRVDLATGEVRTLYTEAGPGKPLKGPNDIVVDRDGGLWFTDLGKTRPREMDRGGVYYAKADGSFITEVAFPMVTANGIGLSPDGATLYVAETEPARLWAFDITGPGQVRKLPWPSPHGGRLVAGMGGYQRFDSLAVEANGNICVATLIHGGITVLSPEGCLVEFVAMPDLFCTNLCFGGEDLRTAYITLSQSGKLIEMPWPRPGLALEA